MRLALISIATAMATMAAYARYRDGRDAVWRAQTAADMAALQAQVGAACEPVYAYEWFEATCPGLTGGLIPQAARAMLCPGRIQVYRSADLEAVRARAQAAGPSIVSLTLEERGVRERQLTLDWRAEVRR